VGRVSRAGVKNLSIGLKNSSQLPEKDKEAILTSTCRAYSMIRRLSRFKWTTTKVTTLGSLQLVTKFINMSNSRKMVTLSLTRWSRSLASHLNQTLVESKKFLKITFNLRFLMEVSQALWRSNSGKHSATKIKAWVQKEMKWASKNIINNSKMKSLGSQLKACLSLSRMGCLNHASLTMPRGWLIH